ncbi:hypothetical protein C7C46_29685 [Streptomyces tateyamensis]|uniref:Uncharacterized protein n=1 Tax=Streptomyces tateyamensis TaxID=565073 RepID=A0A2V4N5U2_9ACTN|nr:hypothetical protein [Streptomyces tateyamensis]PYC68029.1 hypothetical protein C7C46_29685 [Streptomyces tateyamensis]
MFEVHRSIKRFRADPAWEYQRRPQAPWAEFDRRGYPFTLESGRSHLRDLVRGQLAGYQVVLAHQVVPPCGANRGGHLYSFSLAVLELPRALPATAVTCRRLAETWQIDRHQALPPGAGRAQPLPGGGPGARVRRTGADPAFAELLVTEEVKRLTLAADCGWRLEGNRLIGWTDGRRTYEALSALALRLADLVAAFPPAVWEWTG